VRGRKVNTARSSRRREEGVRSRPRDGTLRDLAEAIVLDKQKKHTIEIVVIGSS